MLRLDPALLAEAAPAHFPSGEVAVEFWRRTWAALRLEERYVPLTGLDLCQIAPTVSGEMLRPLLESGATIRMHVNNGVVASFVDTVPLLHPYGRLICHDRPAVRAPGRHQHRHHDCPGEGLTCPPCYPDLHLIQQLDGDRSLGLGVVDVKAEQVESAELITQRIRKALETFPPDKLIVNPDCELRHLPADVARSKLQRW